MLQCTQRAGSLWFFHNLSLQQKMMIGTPFGETYLIFFVGTILQQSLYVGALGGRLQSFGEQPRDWFC